MCLAAYTGGRRQGPMATMNREIGLAAALEMKMSGRAAAQKRRFWLGWLAGFATAGTGSGIVALTISLLTACGALRESRGMSVVVSGLLVGSLGALLLAAHGMDRLAAARIESGL